MGGRLEHIIIVGGGSAGWMCAAALANDIQGACKITLVESETIGTVGVGEATIPPIRQFNARLGIDEATFIRETNGTYKLGIEFADWGRLGETYFHPFGQFGAEFDSVPFYQHWMRENLHGRGGHLNDFTMAWAAAEAGKFEPPLRDRGNIRSTYDYAYHFDATLYARFLRTYSEARGVTRIEGKVTDVKLREVDGHVKSIKLEDGTLLDGDLFVDCTGFFGLLIEKTLKTGYVDWSKWLPCNRAVAVTCENSEATPRPFTLSTAREAGWQWRIPLQHRVGNGYVYCSEFLDAKTAEAHLLESLENPPLTPVKHLQFTTGMREKFWNKNVVAIGLSAGFMEPLESTSLHMIQYGILRLLALLPDQEMSPLLAEEYNRLTRAEYERIRDFLLLHYHATTRDDSAFWRHCRSIEIPESLAYKIAHFRTGGRFVADADELFANASWLAVYIGQNITPEGVPGLVEMRDSVPVSQRLLQIRQAICEAADAMPNHSDYIKSLCA